MSGYNDDFARGEGSQPTRTAGEAERFASSGTGTQSEYQDAGDSGGMGSTYHDTRTGIGGPLGGGSYGGQSSHPSSDRAEVEAVRSGSGQSEDRGRQNYSEQSSVMSGGMGRGGDSETTSATTLVGGYGRGDYVEGAPALVISATDTGADAGGPGYYDRLYNGPQGGGRDGGIGGGAGGRDYSAEGVLGGVVAGIAGTSGTTGMAGGTSEMTDYSSASTADTSYTTTGTSGLTGGDRSTGLGSGIRDTDRSTDTSDTGRSSSSVEAAVERMKHSRMGEVGDTERPGTL